MKFSVIIPAHRDGPAFRACVAACTSLEFPDFEVLVVGDRPFPDLPKNVRFIATGADHDTSPAEKRDIAFAHARGDVLAYIDDDAYPAPDWLSAAARHFEDGSVTVVGGPGVTPPKSTWRERVGGAVYESPVGSAFLRYRFLPLAPRTVDDYPAYNFFVQRAALEAVGGWGTTFYGGEDTVVCLKLAAAGHPVRYLPDVVVYHRRREIVRPHLKQVANVGRHRGYFVRAFPETSRQVLYGLPALAPVVLAGAALLLVRRPLLGLAVIGGGYAAVAAETARRHPPSVAAVTPVVVAAHHLAYGLSFLRGLLGKDLTR